MMYASSILLADAGVWYAFANSDGMGKAIVFLLVISSMVAWCVMIEKGMVLYRAQKLSERFAAAFDKEHGMSSVLRNAMNNPCPVAKVYVSGMGQLLEFYGQTAEEVCAKAAVRDGQGPRKLSSAQLDAVQTAMEREISGQIFVIEERIGWLATAVSLAPFLGLFGTVWGVMIAFCGVASAGSANIQALAPGVAGALLTTVAGLVVAIPSLVGYNYLTQMIRKITVSMDNFSESFMARLKLEQLGARDLDAEKKSAPAPAPAATQQPAAFTPRAAAPAPAAASIPANRPSPTAAQSWNDPAPQAAAPQTAPQRPQYQYQNQMMQQPVSTQYNQGNFSFQQPAQTAPAPGNQGNVYQQQPQSAPVPPQPYQTPAPQEPSAPVNQMSFSNMGSDPDDSMKG